MSKRSDIAKRIAEYMTAPAYVTVGSGLSKEEAMPLLAVHEGLRNHKIWTRTQIAESVLVLEGFDENMKRRAE